MLGRVPLISFNTFVAREYRDRVILTVHSPILLEYSYSHPGISSYT